jgi:tetratricopeptide (TPR) repeat protein
MNITDINKIFEKGLIFYQQGNLDKALIIFNDLLELDPNHFECLNILGCVEGQKSNFRRAIDLLIKAIKINDRNDSCLCNLAAIYHSMGKYKKSHYYYNKALLINPNNIIAKMNKVRLFIDENLLEEAIGLLNKIIISNNEKTTLVEAYLMRGSIEIKMKLFESSLVTHEKVLLLDCLNLSAIFNKGILLSEIGDINASIKQFTLAIKISPNDAELYLARGLQFSKCMKLIDAIHDFEMSIKLNPNNAEAYLNLGVANHDIGNFSKALECYDNALIINKDYKEVLWNKSHTLLIMGNFAEGFCLYESRLNVNKFINNERKINISKWTGKEDLKGKTILILGEQGLGDIIQFVRFLPLVKKIGAKVIFMVDKSLISLFSEINGVDKLLAYEDNLPEFINFHCPLMSLPFIFQINLDIIPSSKKYISVNKSKSEYWNSKLGSKIKTRIGIVWSSVSNIENENKRSIELQKIINLLPVDKYEFISLQKVIKPEEKVYFKEVGSKYIKFYGSELFDFSDTAALASCMDLIISTCTSVPHMTGALGMPTWILLRHIPDWRWQMGRVDSPWYKSVRLYRQDDSYDWDKVLATVSNDLRNII